VYIPDTSRLACDGPFLFPDNVLPFASFLTSAPSCAPRWPVPAEAGILPLPPPASASVRNNPVRFPILVLSPSELRSFYVSRPDLCLQWFRTFPVRILPTKLFSRIRTAQCSEICTLRDKPYQGTVAIPPFFFFSFFLPLLRGAFSFVKWSWMLGSWPQASQKAMFGLVSWYVLRSMRHLLPSLEPSLP
jgi:hypothetical protein